MRRVIRRPRDAAGPASAPPLGLEDPRGACRATPRHGTRSVLLARHADQVRDTAVFLASHCPARAHGRNTPGRHNAIGCAAGKPAALPQIVAAARTAKTSTAATNGLWLAAAVLGPPHAGQRWPGLRAAPGRAGILDSAVRLAAPPGASRVADSRGLDQAQLRGKQQRCQLGQRDSASA